MDLFQYAQIRRDRGMGLAADAEDREHPEFSEAAYQAIQTIAARQSTVHVDDVLRECPLRPHHFNCWGSVWLRAIRNGLIVHSGQVKPCTVDAKKNAHRSPIYRSLIHE